MKNADRMFSLKDLTKRMVQLLMLMVWAAERGVSFTMKFVAEHPTTDQEIPLGKNPLVRVFPGVVQALKRYGLIYIILPVSHPADEAVYSLTRKGQEWVRFLEIYRELTQAQRRLIRRMFEKDYRYVDGVGYLRMNRTTGDKLRSLGLLEPASDTLSPFGWRFAAAMEGRMILNAAVGLDAFLADTGQRPRYALVWAECYPNPLIETFPVGQAVEIIAPHSVLSSLPIGSRGTIVTPYNGKIYLVDFEDYRSVAFAHDELRAVEAE